ncbi:hypothetical protein GW17_00040591 [Ensete ventricosum]|nr:hypothetical protein GW17_00040591 [Ensete ventricosum]
MLRPGVTQEWVDEGEMPRERTKNRRWQRPYDVLAKATRGEVIVRRQVFRVCASKLASDESLGRQHMGAVYHQGSSQIASTSESHGGELIILRYDQSSWRVGLLQRSHSLKGARQVREQSRVSERCYQGIKENRIGVSPTTRWRRPCMRVAVCLSIDQRELLGGHNGVETGGRKERGSDDESSGAQLPKSKASVRKEVDSGNTTVPQRRIYRSRRKGCRCKSTDSRAMGLAAPWYRRGGTSVESSIPCSHGGRALVVKGAEEVENAKANSKYQDRAEGQRPRNFITPMSMGFSSR